MHEIGVGTDMVAKEKTGFGVRRFQLVKDGFFEGKLRRVEDGEGFGGGKCIR